MNIFPDQTLTRTEEDIVRDKLSDPAVAKYLQVLAYNVGRTIVLASPTEGKPIEEHLRAVAGARGQLEVIDMLLEFSKPAEQQSSQ